MATAELDYNSDPTRTERHLIADRYRLRQRIGHGRLGEIYAATDEGDGDLGVGHSIALQIIPENIVRNNSLFNRLSVGFSSLQSAGHSNIVGVRRFGRHRKIGYLAMDLLEGLSLRYILDDAGVLPPDEAKPVIRGVAEALRYLHANGFLHGNLRAKSVFVTDMLDIRLLDVLPLGTDQAVIRGGGTSSPFSRCSTRDDIFGLACMAYEMLSGTHPFNYCAPAEAKQAGLEPERIASLSDREWNALRRALSFDDAWRTASVDAFVRDFGIGSDDRLRLSKPGPAEPAYAFRPPAVAHLPVPSQIPEQMPPVTIPGPVVSTAYRPANPRLAGKAKGQRRTLLLGLLLATILAWSYHGRPQADIGVAMDYVDSQFVPALKALLTNRSEVLVTDPVRASGPETVVRVDEAAAAAPRIKEPDAQLVANAVQTAGDADNTPDPAVTAVELQEEPSDDAGIGPMHGNEEAVASGSVGQLVGNEAPAGSTQPVISVSEGDGVAIIPAPSTGYSEFPLIWWTSDHTAGAGEDFVAVEQQLIDDAVMDDRRVLLVPLVNDSLPEPSESFFVSTGFRDGSKGHIERIATVRVDIVDDD